MAAHVISTGCDAGWRVHNGHVEDRFLEGFGYGSGNGSGGSCDTERLLRLYWEQGATELMRARARRLHDGARRPPAGRGAGVLRDRTGIRPGVLGIKDGKHVVVSEDIALRKNGGDFLEDLDPRRGLFPGPGRRLPEAAACAARTGALLLRMELLRRPRDSIVEGLYVKKLRRALGEMLAEELDLERVDFVSYFPRAPEDAARGSGAGVRQAVSAPVLQAARRAGRSRGLPRTSARSRSHRTST